MAKRVRHAGDKTRQSPAASPHFQYEADVKLRSGVRDENKVGRLPHE